jgi:hypothetical protein
VKHPQARIVHLVVATGVDVEYLAYGSNMFTARLRDRVSSARNARVVVLPGYSVRYRKKSKDGSAKCDLVFVGEPVTAYGVVFDIDPLELPILDRCEGAGSGYDQGSIRVLVGDRSLEALTYLASSIDDDLAPYDWYRNWVVAGAREHGLPDDYIREQLDVSAVPDPNAERDHRECTLLLEALRAAEPR